MCSKVLNGHIILTDTSITTILAPEMTYTPTIIIKIFRKSRDFGIYRNNIVHNAWVITHIKNTIFNIEIKATENC